jgi:guanosine-diphosphatase
MNDLKNGTMNGGQRARYLKTGGIIAFIFLVLYFIAPRDSITRAGGMSLDLAGTEDLG